MTIGEEMKVVLEKMCDCADIKYEEDLFKSDTWYSGCTWNNEQEDVFRAWLYKHLKSKRVSQTLYSNSLTDARTRKLRVAWFIMSYGWRTA